MTTILMKCYLYRSKRHRVKLALVVLTAILLLVSGATVAAGRDQAEENAIRIPPLPKVRVTIASKTADSVTTTVGDSYAVSRQTIIVGIDGRQVSIRKLLVPCDAEVTYSSGQNSGPPLTQMIRVSFIGNDANWKYEGSKE